MRQHHALLAFIALASIACGSPCQELAERVCDCQPSISQRDGCKAAVKNQLGSGSQKPNDADQAACEAKLQTCPDHAKQPDTCALLETAAGKEACGISFTAG